ncbi:MAG: hypothetical protein LBR11_11590 [Deltaproteobacteria bacterium]|nr:hypothetical protein [Deltaproteobacteria bacterium]
MAQAFRKNGVPAQKIIKPLGTAEDILAAYSATEEAAAESIPTPDSAQLFQFGEVAALLDIARRLEIAEIIDEQVAPSPEGLSVGSAVVLATINLASQLDDPAVTPSDLDEWFRETFLLSAFPEANQQSLASPNFWNQLAALDQASITIIEDKLAKRIVENYGLSPYFLLFNTSKFINYIYPDNIISIDSQNNQVVSFVDIGLFLLLNTDYDIPLFHEIYYNSRSNSSNINDIILKLKHRFPNNNDDCQIFLLLPKYDDYSDFIEILENDWSGQAGFVGELSLELGSEFLALEKGNYRRLAGEVFGETSAFRTRLKIAERDLTIIIIDDPKLRERGLKRLKTNILKAKRALDELRNNLTLNPIADFIEGETKLTSPEVGKIVQKILLAKGLKKIFKYEITAINDDITLNYSLDNDNYDYFVNNYLGKSIFFTNLDNWTDEQVVARSRAQSRLVNLVSRTKKTKFLTLSPASSSPDKTFRARVLRWVLALSLRGLLQLEMARLGHKMSAEALLAELSQVRQVRFIYPASPTKPGKAVSALTKASAAAKAYIAAYDLKKYLV